VAHPKHGQVRGRYGGRCGYCGVSEENTGGEQTVDHHIPVTAGGDDGDDNLVYACFRCNLFKADFHPTDADRAKGHVLLHPLRDNVQDHLRLDESTGRLEPITETGRFHIALLHLNRPALVAYRLRQRHMKMLEEREELLEAEIRELRAIIRIQEKYIGNLEKQIEGSSETS
jgi:hypothetical protein